MAAGAWTTEPLGTHTRRSKSMSSLRGLVVVGILVACICVLSTRVEPVAAGPLPMDDMYCGTENCYDILGVDQGASDRDIRRAYRKQSLKWHPDKNIGNTKEAEHMFVALADAYQVLSDPESRSDYDYYLDHPEEAMYNRYRYYYRSAAKTDWRWVVGISVSVASVFLYVLQLNKYNHAVAYYRRDPKTVLRANDLAAERARERGISCECRLCHVLCNTCAFARWDGHCSAVARAPSSPTASLGPSAVNATPSTRAVAPVGGKKANKKAKLEADAAMKKLQVEALNDLVAAVDIQGGYRKPG